MLIAWKSRTTDPSVASYRYRVLTPIEVLQSRGHEVELFAADRAHLYDAVVFSKAYRPADQALARSLRALGKQVVLDLCDNHFYNPYGLEAYEQARVDLARMASLCTSLVCSTPALARVVQDELGLRTTPSVVGDIVEHVAVTNREQTAAPPRLMWFGLHGSPNAPSGMTDILEIAPELEKASANTAFELVVVSNNREKFETVIAPLPFPTRYVEWTPETFVDELSTARAVVLPLSDNPFVACKTHNRLTLALAAGVPVLADAIESYMEFAPYVWLSDWAAGLASVLSDDGASNARRRVRGAASYMAAYWSEDAIGGQWETALGLPVKRASGGMLSLGADGRVFGRVSQDFLEREGLLVELMLNGACVGRTAADLPTLSNGVLYPAGGFIFAADALKSSRKAPLRRCTTRTATGVPVPGAALDLPVS